MEIFILYSSVPAFELFSEFKMLFCSFITQCLELKLMIILAITYLYMYLHQVLKIVFTLSLPHKT